MTEVECRRMPDEAPPAVRELAARWGPGAAVLSGGDLAWVVGYGLLPDGVPGLRLSRTNPAVDRDGAAAAAFGVCPECLASGGTKHDHAAKEPAGVSPAAGPTPNPPPGDA